MSRGSARAKSLDFTRALGHGSATMNRPTHKYDNLLEKIAIKESRSHKKPGKRTKRWRKWADKYKPVDAAQG